MTDRIASDRLEKLEALRAAAIDPYPARVPQPTAIAACLEGIDARQGETVVVGGRLGQVRDFGKLRFAHLRDRTGEIQIGFRRDDLAGFWPQRKLVETADHVVVRGELGSKDVAELKRLLQEMSDE